MPNATQPHWTQPDAAARCPASGEHLALPRKEGWRTKSDGVAGSLCRSRAMVSHLYAGKIAWIAKFT